MASTQGIRAGAAYVELFVQDNRLTRGLARVSQKLKAFGAGITGLGARVGALGAAALSPIVPALETLGEQSQLAAAAEAFGLTAEKASRLFGLMQAGGSDIRDATEGLVTFNQRVADALAGTGEEAQALFQGLGVSAQAFAGLDSADRFTQLIATLRAIPDPAKRVQLLLKAVGEDTGKNLIPVLSMTADEVAALGDAFEQSTADLAQARDTQRAYALATAQLSGIWRQVVGAIAPSIRDLASWVSRAIKPVAAWVRENREAVRTAALVAAVVLGVGGALIVLGTSVSVAGFALGGFVSLLTVVGSVLGMIATPVGAVIAALVTLGTVFVTQTEAGRWMTEELKVSFLSFADTATTAWGGIVDAITAGELELAARIALAAVSLTWAQAVLEWTTLWQHFQTTVVDGWYEAVTEIKLLITDASAWIARTFAGTLETLFQSIAQIADRLGLDDLARQYRDNLDFSEATVNRNRERMARQIQDSEMQRQRDADLARQTRRDRAQDQVQTASEELRGLVDEAARRRAALAQRALPKPEARPSSLNDIVDLARKVDVQGTFNALALRGLGGETMNTRTARAVDQINDNVKRIALAAAHGALVFA